ncbi:MAG: dihydropteroate synthase [Candidatus Omnitrophica bacterium]|nr:dihydropteroate synthase [Candidatus Omnitrophota bacterium]
MRILSIDNRKILEEVMQEIKVDPYGIKIMSQKGISFFFRINSVSNIAANILKQEMLSFGGDVAIPRDALTGKFKKADCLIMGNLSQINRLNKKLSHQPFGLSHLAGQLQTCLNNYQKDNFTIDLGRYKLHLGKRTLVMGILNLTPDSFSGDGLLGLETQEIIEKAQALVQDGADIIDLGGQSSRPGAKPVSLIEELSRTIPVVKALAKKIKIPISIDTCKPQVAKQALDSGALIVNDITGLRDPLMCRVVSRNDCAVIIMHMKGNPRTMQRSPFYKNLIDEIIEFLDTSIIKAQDLGVDRNKIIIDPGIGFGKSLEDNLEILKRLREFKVLGRPIMVGTSRKSFLGKILRAQPDERLSGTVSSSVLAAQNGAKILRVHDVKQVKQALKVLHAINN